MPQRTEDEMRLSFVQWAIGVFMAGLVAYFTTQMSVTAAVAKLEATERAHYESATQNFQLIREDLKDIRAAVSEEARLQRLDRRDDSPRP